MMTPEDEIPCFECVDDRMAEIYRRMTPEDRLAVAIALWRSTRQMVFNLVRSQHPDWDEARLRKETAGRMSHGLI